MKVRNEGAKTVTLILNGERYTLKPTEDAIIEPTAFAAVKNLYPMLKEVAAEKVEVVVTSSANPIQKKEPKNVGKNKKQRK